MIGFVVYLDSDDARDMVPLADEQGQCRLRLATDYDEAQRERGWLDVVAPVTAARYRVLNRAAQRRPKKGRTNMSANQPVGLPPFIAQVGRAVAAVCQREQSEPGFVYLIRAEGLAGVYKIGKATDPERRRREHQPSSPVELVIELVIPSERMGRLETDLKTRFADQCIHYEWFRLTAADVAWIRQLGADLAAGAQELAASPD